MSALLLRLEEKEGKSRGWWGEARALYDRSNIGGCFWVQQRQLRKTKTKEQKQKKKEKEKEKRGAEDQADMPESAEKRP